VFEHARRELGLRADSHGAVAREEPDELGFGGGVRQEIDVVAVAFEELSGDGVNVFDEENAWFVH
jgi:hypothetical protein